MYEPSIYSTTDIVRGLINTIEQQEREKLALEVLVGVAVAGSFIGGVLHGRRKRRKDYADTGEEVNLQKI